MLILGGIFALGILAGVVASELAAKLLKQEQQEPAEPQQPARRWWEVWKD